VEIVFELEENWVASTILGIDLCVARVEAVLVAFIFWHDVVAICALSSELVHMRLSSTYFWSQVPAKADLSLVQVAHGTVTALRKSH